MAVEVKMPQLGLTMEEGTVTKWLKQEGDAVKAGDILLEITTDKLTSEVASEAEGILLKIVAQEGELLRQHRLLRHRRLRHRKKPERRRLPSSAAARAGMLRQSVRRSLAEK